MSSFIAVQVPAAAGPGSHVPPYKLAFFNNPLTGRNINSQLGSRSQNVPVPGMPSSITTAIVGLLESAGTGATIDIAMFQAGDGRLATATADTQLIRSALKDAAKRVHAVNVLTDGSVDEDQTFWNQIARIRHVTVKRCNHACFFNGHALMHNKFMLVDNTKWTPGTEDVVLQMTSNWRNSQLSSRLWNSALQFWGDTDLYAGYRRYFDQMWTCAPNCVGTPSPQGFNGKPGSGVHVTVFPQRGVADPIITELDDLRVCSRGEVDVAMNGWQADTRGLLILRRLEQLVDSGCMVRVVVQKTTDARSIGALLPSTNLAPTAHCTDGRDDGQDPTGTGTGQTETANEADLTQLVPTVHSKYILIRGTYKGQKNSMVVSTGSERFVNASLNRADETWVKLLSSPTYNQDNAAVYAAYLANFNAMWASTPAC